MRFEDSGLGYAFTLSGNWKDASDTFYNPSNVETKSYVSRHGLISIMVGIVEDHLASPSARRSEFERYLQKEMGHSRIESTVGTRQLGGEANTIVSEFLVDGRRQCMICAVHSERQFLIRFEANLNNVQERSDLNDLLQSFEFLQPAPTTRYVPPEEVRVASPNQRKHRW